MDRKNGIDTGTQPYALAREEGQAVWFLGALLVVKATGEQTGGACGLIEHLLPPGAASPYHVHRNEDEAYYVVEGEMTFYVGEKRIEAGGTGPARMLLFNTPAGFEGFPMEAGEPAEELTLPPAGPPPDLERLVRIAATYGIEILGPLPGR